MQVKRPSIKIRMKILSYLKKLPMTRYELSVMINTNPETVQKHLDYLEILGKVEKGRLLALDKELWFITKNRSASNDIYL